MVLQQSQHPSQASLLSEEEPIMATMSLDKPKRTRKPRVKKEI